MNHPCEERLNLSTEIKQRVNIFICRDDNETEKRIKSLFKDKCKYMFNCTHRILSRIQKIKTYSFPKYLSVVVYLNFVFLICNVHAEPADRPLSDFDRIVISTPQTAKKQLESLYLVLGF